MKPTIDGGVINYYNHSTINNIESIKMSRKQAIETAAKEIINEIGVVNMTRPALCHRAGVPQGSFQAIMGQTFTEFLESFEDLGNSVTIDKGRSNPKHRKHQLINASMELAETHGYNKITREQIAKHAGVSVGAVSNYLGTMKNLRRDIIRHAIKNNTIVVIMQAMLNNDPHAKKATPTQREAATAMAVTTMAEG